MAHLGLGRFDLAARAARRAFALRPVWTLDDFQLAQVLLAEGATKLAGTLEPALAKHAVANASDPDAVFLLALFQHAAGKRVSARDTLQRILDAFPEHRPSRQLLAAYEGSGSRREWKSTGPGERPDDPMIRGLHLLWTGDPRRAAIALGEAVALDPAAADPRIELAHALFAASRYPLAGRVLLDGLARAADPARRRLDLYERFRSAEEIEKQMGSLEEYVRSNPSDSESVFLLAYALLHTDQAQQAVPLFDLLAKGRADDRLIASFAEEARRRRDGAVAEGPPGVQGPEGQAARRVEVGLASFKKGDYEIALPAFEEALRLDDSKPQHHFCVALARFALGRYSAAGLAFRQGMRHVRDWKTFAFDWSGAYARPEDFQTHLVALDRHTKANPNDNDTRLFYGVVQLSRRNFPEAILAFKQNGQVDPADTLSLELHRQATERVRSGHY